MLTKETITNQINVRADGQIEVQEATYILEDGVRIGEPSYHRYVLIPGLTVPDARVMAIARAVHTPAVIAAFRAAEAARRRP